MYFFLSTINHLITYLGKRVACHRKPTLSHYCAVICFVLFYNFIVLLDFVEQITILVFWNWTCYAVSILVRKQNNNKKNPYVMRRSMLIGSWLTVDNSLFHKHAVSLASFSQPGNYETTPMFLYCLYDHILCSCVYYKYIYIIDKINIRLY